MHQDGIGSSRLLLAPKWSQAYYLALPDRSYGLLVPRDVTVTKVADVQKMVKSMCSGATVPMSDQLYTSADLPAAWTTPLTTQPSQAVLEAIAQLTTP